MKTSRPKRPIKVTAVKPARPLRPTVVKVSPASRTLDSLGKILRTTRNKKVR